MHYCQSNCLQSPDGNLEDESEQTSTYHNMSRPNSCYYLLDKLERMNGSCMSVSHLACLRVILYVCESSSISKRQGIYSVIVYRLLSLLLCIALAKCHSWCLETQQPVLSVATSTSTNHVDVDGHGDSALHHRGICPHVDVVAYV